MANWEIFHDFLKSQFDGNALNLDSGGISMKCMLVDSTRAPVQATDADMATIDNNEVSGTNYTAGGAALSAQAISVSAGVVKFDCDDIAWSEDAAGFTDARYAVIYYTTGTPANDVPICYADFGVDKGNTTGDLTIQMDATGVLTFTVS